MHEGPNHDAKLSSITVRSKDGFAFNLDVAQIIHVGALDAPKVISRVGSMQNLVDHVLQAIDSLIGDIQSARRAHADPGPTARSRRSGARPTRCRRAAQIQRQQLVRRTSLADIQQQVVGAEQGVNIAELQAGANVKQATGEAEATRLHALGEAEAIRALGQAKAEAYRVGVEAIGAQGYTVMQLMQIIGERNVRIVPDVAVTGANSSPGLVDGLLGVMLKAQSAKVA